MQLAGNEVKMLKHTIDARERQIDRLRHLLYAYMQHVIETKGQSYLDRHGLLVTDSKALTDADLVDLRGIEKEVKKICVTRSSAAGAIPTSEPSTSYLRHMPGVITPLP